jgi:hypothetical protein
MKKERGGLELSRRKKRSRGRERDRQTEIGVEKT